MDKSEMFEEIFHIASRMASEYAEYRKYILQKHGLIYSKPKTTLESKLELVDYGIRRTLAIKRLLYRKGKSTK